MSGYIGSSLVGQNTQIRTTVSATSGQTILISNGYQPGYLDIFRILSNGTTVKLMNGINFTANNSPNITLTSPAVSGDIYEIISYLPADNGNPRGIINRQSYIATQNQSVFSIKYTVGDLDVFLNGIKLYNTDFVATNGSNITLLNPANSGDKIDLLAYTSYSVDDVLQKSLNGIDIPSKPVFLTNLGITATAGEINRVVGTLPSLTGHAYKFTRVNPGETAIEFVAPTSMLAGTALSGLETTHTGGAGFLVVAGNRAIGATEPTNPVYWSASEVVSGVTFTQISSDVDPATGNTRVTYDAVGTLSATSASFGYVSTASLTNGLSGENWTASAFIAVTGPAGGGAGAAQVGTGVRMFQFQSGASPQTLQGNLVTAARTLASAARTLTVSNPLRTGVQLAGTIGTVINARIVIEGLQFEKAAARTNGLISEVPASQASLLMAQPGARLGYADGEYTAQHSVTSGIPLDSSAPLWTEGAHLISVNYVPKKIGSKLLITATLPVVGMSVAATAIAALYVNEVAAQTARFTPTNGGYEGGITVRHILTVTSLSSIKVSLRFGPQDTGYTAFINRGFGAATMGDTVSTLLTVEEIAQ